MDQLRAFSLNLERGDFAMTATRTNRNGHERKTLASQLDRLDGILDGLDTALTGAVQQAVEQAVKQAVQAVLTEVLTNHQLQQQLPQAAQPTPPQPPRGKKRTSNRLWQVTTEAARQTVHKVKQLGRGVGVAVVAAGSVIAAVVYAARARIASAAVAVDRIGKSLILRAGTALIRLVPVSAFGGT
jgi:hypothetical protein